MCRAFRRGGPRPPAPRPSEPLPAPDQLPPVLCIGLREAASPPPPGLFQDVCTPFPSTFAECWEASPLPHIQASYLFHTSGLGILNGAGDHFPDPSNDYKKGGLSHPACRHLQKPSGARWLVEWASGLEMSTSGMGDLGTGW